MYKNGNSNLLKNIVKIMSSNVLMLIGSIITGLVVPLMLGATKYGYYRLFTLYSSYTALLHFGFVDGILLVHSGENYNTLNRYKFRSNSIFFIFFQAIISIAFLVSSLIVSDDFYKILLISLGINIFLFNIITYYQYVSQATMRFSEFSLLKSFQSILTIVLILLVFILYKLGFVINISPNIFISIVLFTYLVLFIWYIYTYRNITFGTHESLLSSLDRFKNYFITGFFFTFTYQIAILILNVDNQLVSIFFNAGAYGVYSFAYSSVSTLQTILDAISVVLLPNMKVKSKEYLVHIHSNMVSDILIISYFFLCVYFLLPKILQIILPQYTNSLPYFIIFLPGICITCCITIVVLNYFIVLNKSKLYFLLSSIILLVAIVFDLFTYHIFKSPFYISIASFISILLWYIISEYYLNKLYGIKWMKNFLYIIILSVIFFTLSNLSNMILGFILYIIFYVLLSLAMFYKLVKNNIILIINKYVDN